MSIFKDKKYIKEYKEKYYQIFLDDVIKTSEKAYREIMGEELWSSYVQSVIKETNRRFELENMSNHKTVIPNTEHDITPYITDLIGAEVEIMKIIIVDDNGKPIKCHTISSNSSTIIFEPLKEVFKFLLKEDAKRFIWLHNHPHNVAAVFSEGDTKIDFNLLTLAKALNIELIDSMIVTDFDFVSRYQCEHSPCDENKQLGINREKIFTRDVVSKKITDKIYEEDKMLYFLILNLVNRRVKPE